MGLHVWKRRFVDFGKHRQNGWWCKLPSGDCWHATCRTHDFLVCGRIGTLFHHVNVARFLTRCSATNNVLLPAWVVWLIFVSARPRISTNLVGMTYLVICIGRRRRCKGIAVDILGWT